MKNLIKLIFVASLLAASCKAAIPTYGDFNTTQFGTNGGKLSLKSGVPVTNLTASGVFTLKQNTPTDGLLLRADSDEKVKFIVPGAEGFLLLISNGVPTYSTNIPSAVVTNLTVVTNNVSVLNVSQTIKVNGKAATVFSVNGTEMPIANITNSSTVTASAVGTNITFSATGSGGSAGSTNYRSPIIELTMTGTNVDGNQIDWAKTNQCYRLRATGDIFFGDAVCTNVPDTNSFQWIQVHIIQDNTGIRLLTMTNSIYAPPSGSPVVLSTNANAWDTLTFMNSPVTNGNIAVLPALYLRR